MLIFCIPICVLVTFPDFTLVTSTFLNVFTSLFNSHLFDFHEGWMYVIGVGVAGGMVIRAQRAGQKTVEAGS